MVDDHVPAARRTGPSRSTATSDAIRDALVVELAAHGYERTSLEAVARRAGVGKAAIYRRWDAKAAMVVDVVEQYAATADLWPDLGSLDADLRAFFRTIATHLTNPTIARIVSDLFACGTRDSAFATDLHERVGIVRRARGVAMIERAVERGELPAGCDLALAADLIAAPLYWRLAVTREPLPDAYFDQLVVAVTAAIRATST